MDYIHIINKIILLKIWNKISKEYINNSIKANVISILKHRNYYPTPKSLSNHKFKKSFSHKSSKWIKILDITYRVFYRNKINIHKMNLNNLLKMYSKTQPFKQLLFYQKIKSHMKKKLIERGNFKESKKWDSKKICLILKMMFKNLNGRKSRAVKNRFKDKIW